MERRIKYVLSLIEMGWSEEYDIMQIIRKNKQWTVTDRQLRNYITKCFRILQNYAQENVEKVWGTVWLRHEGILRAAIKDGSWVIAIDVLREQAKLAGLYRPSKFALTDPTGSEDYGQRFANISFIEAALRANPELQEKLVDIITEMGNQGDDTEPGGSGTD